MGSLDVNGSQWTVMAPTTNSPQQYGAGGEVAQWTSTDRGITWTQKHLLTAESPRNHNYVRRVVNGRAPFLYFWADGNPDSLSQSVLYIGDEQGHYGSLPYQMKGAREKLRMKGASE